MVVYEELLIGTGEEVKPVAKAMWRHSSQHNLLLTFAECPRFAEERIYGLDLEFGTVWTAEALVERLIEEITEKREKRDGR